MPPGKIYKKKPSPKAPAPPPKTGSTRQGMINAARVRYDPKKRMSPAFGGPPQNSFTYRSPLSTSAATPPSGGGSPAPAPLPLPDLGGGDGGGGGGEPAPVVAPPPPPPPLYPNTLYSPPRQPNMLNIPEQFLGLISDQQRDQLYQQLTAMGFGGAGQYGQYGEQAFTLPSWYQFQPGSTTAPSGRPDLFTTLGTLAPWIRYFMGQYGFGRQIGLPVGTTQLPTAPTPLPTSSVGPPPSLPPNAGLPAVGLPPVLPPR